MGKYVATGILLFVMAAMLAACGRNTVVGDPDAELQFKRAASDQWSNMPENSPEQLALQSGQLYQEMMNDRITPEDGLDQMIQMAAENGAAAMQEQRTEVISSIRMTKESIEKEGDRIESFDYSECIPEQDYDNRVTIYRIQHMKSGKKYYFKQDFIKENGEWKIYGDNVENPFGLS